jgi:hypothetical protein
MQSSISSYRRVASSGAEPLGPASAAPHGGCMCATSRVRGRTASRAPSGMLLRLPGAAAAREQRQRPSGGGTASRHHAHRLAPRAAADDAADAEDAAAPPATRKVRNGAVAALRSVCVRESGSRGNAPVIILAASPDRAPPRRCRAARRARGRLVARSDRARQIGSAYGRQARSSPHSPGANHRVLVRAPLRAPLTRAAARRQLLTRDKWLPDLILTSGACLRQWNLSSLNAYAHACPPSPQTRPARARRWRRCAWKRPLSPRRA